MAVKPSIRASMLLGLLELSTTPLSSIEIESNFDVPRAAAEEVFEELAEEGYVDELDGGYYDINERGSTRVEMRSPATGD